MADDTTGEITEPSEVRQAIQAGWAPGMGRVLKLPSQEWVKALRAKQSFYDVAQHDHHGAAWDGSKRDAGTGYMSDRMRSAGFVPSNAPPFGSRKPEVVVPIARTVTQRFTDRIFGASGVPPAIEVPSDPDTEAFLRAINTEAKTWDTLKQVRNIAGGCGAAAIVQSVIDGTPCTEELQPWNLWISWKQSADWIPEQVMEQILVEVETFDEADGKLKRSKVWRSRMWTEEHAIRFEDVPEDYDPKLPIPVAADGVVEHGSKQCPVTWIQNTRSTTGPYGECDNEGAWSMSDAIDKQASMNTRATRANTDPTLVYSDEKWMMRQNPVLRKGWGAVIRTSEKGKAALLEISGSSLEQGWKTVAELERRYENAVGCAVIDPVQNDQQSGEALSILQRANASRCNARRMPIATAMRRVNLIWIELGLTHKIGTLDDDKEEGIRLPPVITKISPPKQAPMPPLQPGEEPREPEPPPQPTIESSVHKIGPGRYSDICWPPFDEPTPAQLAATATALSTATGQQPVLSQETGVQVMVGMLGRNDASEELERIRGEVEARRASITGAMFPDDGEDDGGDQPPPGKQEPPKPGKPKPGPDAEAEPAGEYTEA